MDPEDIKHFLQTNFNNYVKGKEANEAFHDVRIYLFITFIYLYYPFPHSVQPLYFPIWPKKKNLKLKSLKKSVYLLALVHAKKTHKYLIFFG